MTTLFEHLQAPYVTLETVDRLLYRILDDNEEQQLDGPLDPRVERLLVEARAEIQIRMASDVKSLGLSDAIAASAHSRVRSIHDRIAADNANEAARLRAVLIPNPGGGSTAVAADDLAALAGHITERDGS